MSLILTLHRLSQPWLNCVRVLSSSISFIEFNSFLKEENNLHKVTGCKNISIKKYTLKLTEQDQSCLFSNKSG